jgi:threonine/homoserine/homoserine lactone efflux protein
MFADVFCRGLVIGISIAAPVGPIGVLCIKRTLTEGRAVGFVSGLGAACADGLYGVLAVSGLTWITDSMLESRVWLHILGGLFLCYLGIKTFFARTQSESSAGTLEPEAFAGLAVAKGELGRAFASTFVLTLSNPMTILSFVAIFAALGNSGSSSSPVLMVLGVFTGSALWWLFLSAAVGALRGHLSARALACTNIFSGVIITAFGAFALCTSFS